MSCRGCIYKAPKGSAHQCDYLYHVGHSRGCPIEGCTKKKTKGQAMRRRDRPVNLPGSLPPDRRGNWTPHKTREDRPGPARKINEATALELYHQGLNDSQIAAELGECVLRLLDYLATADVDIDAEMGFVPSGDTLPGLVCDCTRFLAKAHISTTAMDGSEEKKFFNLIMCIDVIKDWFAENNISMESILRELHECEKARAGRRERAEP